MKISDTQCAKTLVENCSRCEAAESCGQYLQRWTDLSKEECMDECESDESCYLVEYTTRRPQVCSLYNCTKTVDSSGSETVLYLCNTGNFVYMYATNKNILAAVYTRADTKLKLLCPM